MSAHFGTGFVLTPRPATPASQATVVLPGAQSVDVAWPRVTGEFAPELRVAPEPEPEEEV
jgi:hypothetical protein